MTETNNAMTVLPVLATRGEPYAYNGLITLQVHLPVYIWTEILTHRRFARNASSSRAQRPDRHVGMGHYTPETFYEDRPGMSVGAALPEDTQILASRVWEQAWEDAVSYVNLLTELGVSREQANRLLPTIKMVTGIITGTEHAWEKFLELRLTTNADTAMQIFARSVKHVIDTINWQYSGVHVPFGGHPMEAAGRIARVTYSGKNDGDNFELAQRLLYNGHMSPFEHIAWFVSEDDAGLSALNCKPEDTSNSGYVWDTMRSKLEIGEDWVDFS